MRFVYMLASLGLNEHPTVTGTAELKLPLARLQAVRVALLPP